MVQTSPVHACVASSASASTATKHAQAASTAAASSVTEAAQALLQHVDEQRYHSNVFKALAYDMLSNDLTPEQQRDPKYQIRKNQETGEISLSQPQRSWINSRLRDHLGSGKVAFYGICCCLQ